MNINDLVTIINSKYFAPEEKLWAKAEFQRRKNSVQFISKQEEGKQ